MSQLNASQKHMLRLIRQGADQEGWAKVSKLLWPLVNDLSKELTGLIELKPAEDGGFAKLTSEGETVLKWL